MPQDDLFPETDFGGQCARLIREEELSNGVMTEARMREIINAQFDKARPSRLSRKGLDGLVRDLCEACALSVESMTEPAIRLASVSVRQIIAVTPSADKEEFQRRVSIYRKLYRETNVTPRGLSMNWAQCKPKEAAHIPLPEPASWRETYAAMAARSGWYTNAIAAIKTMVWNQLSRQTQRSIVGNLPPAESSAAAVDRQNASAPPQSNGTCDP